MQRDTKYSEVSAMGLFVLIAFASICLLLPGLSCFAKGEPEKGEDLFRSMQCYTCHPAGGNIINPSLPLKGRKFLEKFPQDGPLGELIREGIPGTAMPGYSKDRMSDEELSDLIAYVRSLTPQKKDKKK